MEYFYIIFLVVFILLAILVVLGVWYYAIRDTIGLTGIANSSGYIPYPYDRKKCQELVLAYNPTKKYRIAIVSVSIGNRKFAQITREYLSKYCKKHNYDLYYFTEVVDPKYNIMWQKVVAFNKVMMMDKHDYVAWYDDDIVIKNMDIKLESFIDLTDKPIILSRDVFKKYNNLHINAGCFVMKNCEVTKQLLPEWLDGCDNLYNGRFKEEYHHDQTILTYLYFKKYHPSIECIPHGIMQTLYKRVESWEGEFATHLSGLRTKPRNRLMELYKKTGRFD